jgi:microcompartment protein CcmL/EutN
VTEFGDIATPELLEAVKGDVAELRAAIDGGDAIAIREHLQKLELSAYKMAESMYGS